MTPFDCDAVDALCEALEDDVWTVEYTDNGIETTACGPIKARYRRDNTAMREEAEAIAAFIAQARTLLPQAVARIRELEATEFRLRFQLDSIVNVLTEGVALRKRAAFHLNESIGFFDTALHNAHNTLNPQGDAT